MIQDIAPSKLYNSFKDYKLRDDDSVFFFDETGKVLTCGKDGKMEVPAGSDCR